MRLRNCLGMIWSVSMLGNGSGAALLVRILMGSIMRSSISVVRIRSGLQPSCSCCLLPGAAPQASRERAFSVNSQSLRANSFLLFPVADVGEVAGDGCCCGHLRTD